MELCCKNNPESLCYVCGVFPHKNKDKKCLLLCERVWDLFWDWTRKRRKILDTQQVLLVYRAYFDQLFRFTSPTSWREPQNHIDDCYFCLTDVKGYSSKWKDSIIYPNVSSVTKAAYNRKDSISGNFTKRIAEEANYSNENRTMEHELTRNLP